MRIRYNHCAPQFIVQNVTDAIEFYSKILGFNVDYLSGSPPEYAVVFRDEVYIHLCNPEAHELNPQSGSVFISVTGIEEIWKQVVSLDVKIIKQLSDEDYGSGVKFKTFIIEDPDQNILRIGEPIKNIDR